MSSLRRFRKQPHTRAQGATAEAEGIRYLKRQGYEILETNVTNKVGEIDVVAQDGDTRCFVEIKARATPTYGEAVEAVDARKRRRITRTAALYLAQTAYEGPCRFDVLGLDSAPDGWRFTLLRDAFGLDY